MSELFNVLKNFKNDNKKYFIEIDGKQIEVSLQKKIEVQQNGLENYILQNDKLVLQEVKPDRNTFAEIKDMKSDPFWPDMEFIWKK